MRKHDPLQNFNTRLDLIRTIVKLDKSRKYLEFAQWPMVKLKERYALLSEIYHLDEGDDDFLTWED